MPPRPLTIVHADERLLVVAKPPGLLTVPAPKGGPKTPDLVARLRSEGHRVHAVHRLDRETSGAVLLARDPEARDALMRLFKERRVEKTYLAILPAPPTPPSGRLDFPIRDLGATARIDPRGQAARTRYRTLERVGPGALVEVAPETGRHNQIRLQFAHVGLPLVGERKYARGRDAAIRHKRVALHALRLELTPPWSDGPLRVEVPLAQDLLNLLDKMRRGE